jgi:hypothetical protein
MGKSGCVEVVGALVVGTDGKNDLGCTGAQVIKQAGRY